MELLLGFLIFLLVAGPILSLVVLARMKVLREQGRRIERLESRLRTVVEELEASRTRRAAAEVPALEERVASGEPEAEEPLPKEPLPREPLERPEPLPSREARGARPERARAEAERGAGEELSKPGTRRRALDLEQWLGVRAAAVVAGIAISLAGIFLVHEAIQKGLLGPAARVAVATVAGLACLVATFPLMKRGYRILGEVLAGAGAVVLYGAAWAGCRLYELFPLGVGFAWMVAVTVVCGLFSLRRGSRITAVFGMVGGFATPLLLSSAEDRPLDLFGYLLLLDLGYLALGRRMRWGTPAFGCLVGTTLLQGLWLVHRMEPGAEVFGLSVLGIFALLLLGFARPTLAGDRAGQVDDGLRWLSRIGSLLVPLAYAVYFASRVDLGEHLLPVGGLLLVLTAGALLTSLREPPRTLAHAVALGSAGVLSTWVARHWLDARSTWELAGVLVAGAGLHAAADGWRRRRGLATGSGLPSTLTFTLPALILLGFFSTVHARVTPFAPALAGLLLLAIACARAAESCGLSRLHLLTGAGLGAFLAIHSLEWAARDPGDGGPSAYGLVAAGVLVAAAALALGWRRPERDLSRHRCGGAVAVAIPLVLVLQDGLGIPWPRHAALLFAPIALALVAACRAGSPAIWVPAALASTWSTIQLGLRQDLLNPPVVPGAALAAMLLAAVLVVAGSPFLVPTAPAFRGRVARVAALSPLLWFGPATLRPFEAYVGESTGYLAVASTLAAVAAAGAWFAERIPENRGRAAARIGAAVSVLMLGFGIAFEVGILWGAMGLVLTGIGWLALPRIVDEPRLAVLGTALLLAGCALTSLLGLVPGKTPASEALLLNRLLYTHALPALCCALGIGALRGRRGDEEPDGLERTVRAALGLGCALTLFFWLNMVVLDAFTEGRSTIDVLSDRLPARELTMSLVWAAYALVLLALGTARGLAGARRLSLVFLIAVTGKAFLYDLGHLGGLYRVVSLAGLALALLTISLLYQRFVFRSAAAGSDPSA